MSYVLHISMFSWKKDKSVQRKKTVISKLLFQSFFFLGRGHIICTLLMKLCTGTKDADMCVV